MEKIYNSEEEFLKDYDPNKFRRLSMTTDILIFSVSDGIQENYRKLNKKYFSVLLVKRNSYPFKDKWCLPGGFIGYTEDIEEASGTKWTYCGDQLAEVKGLHRLQFFMDDWG